MTAIDELLKKDIEDVHDYLRGLMPTSGRRVLLDLINFGSIDAGIAAQWASAVQSLLARDSLLISSGEAIKLARRILTLPKADDAGERASISAIVGLLGFRVPGALEVRDLDSIVQRIATRHSLAGDASIRERNRSALSRKGRKPSQRTKASRTLAPSLNLQQASKHVEQDLKSDWYSDPWRWPEVQEAASLPRGELINFLATPTSLACALDVPKDSGAMRAAAVIGPTERVVYQALVDMMARPLLLGLPTWVYGWRVARDAEPGQYADNGQEWEMFQRDLETLSRKYKYSCHVDVRDFFESTDVEVCLLSIERQIRQTEALDSIRRIIASVNLAAGRRGLPQRCRASSILAHAMLRPIDGYLSAWSNASQRACARWMDDISLFSNSERDLSEAAREIDCLLRDTGLRVNSAKTRFAEGPEMRVRAAELRNELAGAGADGDRLDAIFLRWFSEELPQRASVGFGLKEARHRSRDQVAARLLEEGPGMEKLAPSATYVASAIRRGGLWQKHEERFLNYARRHIAPPDATTQAWEQMFPREFADSLLKLAELRVEEGYQTAFLPACCDRVALALRSRNAQELLVESLRAATRPFEARALAFGAFGAGVSGSEISRALSPFDSLTLSCAHLEQEQAERDYAAGNFDDDDDDHDDDDDDNDY
jgi:hypothetical protein